LSLQCSGGHIVRGHLISKVLISHWHTVHVSNPFGGKYGCHDAPAKWNWSPSWQPRVTSVVFGSGNDLLSAERETTIINRPFLSVRYYLSGYSISLVDFFGWFEVLNYVDYHFKVAWKKSLRWCNFSIEKLIVHLENLIIFIQFLPVYVSSHSVKGEKVQDKWITMNNQLIFFLLLSVTCQSILIDPN